MALSRKYKALLFRAKLNPLFLHNVKKAVNKASDFELVLLHDKIVQALKDRGILDNGESNKDH